MSFDQEVERNWLNDFEHFLLRWEQETEGIKEKTLDPDECFRISEMFHKDWNGLVIRKPVNVAGDFFNRFEQLDHKLTTTLAMVCHSSKNKL